jgi:hypothetical protein
MLVEIPEGKSALGRPSSIWENVIKVDFREIRLEGRIGFCLKIGTGGGLL